MSRAHCAHLVALPKRQVTHQTGNVSMAPAMTGSTPTNPQPAPTVDGRH